VTTLRWSALDTKYKGREIRVPFGWSANPLTFTYVRPIGPSAPVAVEWAPDGSPVETASTCQHVLRWPDGTEGAVQHRLDVSIELLG
jgi:hypothetical protein